MFSAMVSQLRQMPRLMGGPNQQPTPVLRPKQQLSPALLHPYQVKRPGWTFVQSCWGPPPPSDACPT